MIVMSSGDPEDCRRLNKLIAEHFESDIERFENIPSWMFQERFPEWLAIDPAQFEGTFRRLLLMATDPFDHELTPFYEWLLYHSLRDWLEFAEECEAEVDDPELVAEYRQSIADINLALEVAFWDWDFLMVPDLVRALQQDAGLVEELGVDLAAYLELMPADVRAKVEAQLEAKAERNEQDAASPPKSPT